MRAAWVGAFAPALLAGFAVAADALETWVFLLVVALLLAAVLFVNLPALVLEVFADAPALLVKAFVEADFEEEGFLPPGLASAAGFSRFAVVAALATFELTFTELALSTAPLVETGAFFF